ncbi:MAG TPA: DUF58 domain-containing protein [Gammaproteobacteria bacterium]|nr:DUF58 domain-containing protein [Gammaproteobacteria bacterium]
MNRSGVRPHRRLLILGVALLGIVAVGASLPHPVWQSLTAMLAIGAVIVALFDLYRALFAPTIVVSRQAPTNLSLQKNYDCALSLINNDRRTLHVDMQEHYPAEIELAADDRRYTLAPSHECTMTYRMRATRRGSLTLAGTEIRLDSPLRLWQSNWQFDNAHGMNVYPDFTLVRSTDALDGVVNTPVTGLKNYSRRGEGMEFHQLREYRRGDSLRQIDWKATSRRQKLISREYQEERNQQIIVMLDAGKRMNVRTETGSHFDTALGALLMLGHTVLHQGDWFSMQSFGVSERWLPNVKGAQDIARVMNHFYDLYPEDCASDYLRAAQALVEKKPKRALVLLVTTLGSEDFSDLMPAVELLQQHHLVAVVSIKNQAITDVLNTPVESDQDANTYCAALELEQEQIRNISRLSKTGAICGEFSPAQLLPAALNIYLSVKRGGLL